MSELSKQTLLSLRDFIGDALSDPEVTPNEIAQAIIDELTELVEYHGTARSKAQETLSLLDKKDDVSDAWDYFVKDDSSIDSSDVINFNLTSDFLVNPGQPVDIDNMWGQAGQDTIDFTSYLNKKDKWSNKKNKNWDK